VVIEALAAAVDGLFQIDCARLSDAELGDLLVAERREMDRQEAVFAGHLRAFDERKGHQREGATSAIAWMKSRCGLSGGGAAQRMDIARELPSITGADDCFRNGEISFHNAAVLARTAAEIGPEAAAMASPALVDAAQKVDPDRMRLIGRQLRHTVDPDGALAQALRDHARRRLSVSQSFDGLFSVDGLLDAEGGALLRTALDALSAPLPNDDRTAVQRRADALVELAARQLRRGELPMSGGVRPHLIVTATDDAISGERDAAPADLLGVGAIPAATLQRLACDADLSEIIVSPSGEPLDVGRARRTAPPQMRRALVKRFQGCSWPGCDRPPAWTEAHHVLPWSKSRETKLDNLVPLCRVHHRYVHEDGWRLTIAGDKVEAHPPWIPSTSVSSRLDL
jgi:hypothetical protein